MPQIDDAEIERRFTSHPPDEEKAAAHNDVRVQFKKYARTLAVLLPEGREKSLAFTALEEASFWAQAAIAREGR